MENLKTFYSELSEIKIKMLKEINDFWERSPVKEFDLDELEINTISIQEYDIVKISDNGLITSDNTDFSFSDLDLFDLDLIIDTLNFIIESENL